MRKGDYRTRGGERASERASYAKRAKSLRLSRCVTSFATLLLHFRSFSLKLLDCSTSSRSTMSGGWNSILKSSTPGLHEFGDAGDAPLPKPLSEPVVRFVVGTKGNEKTTSSNSRAAKKLASAIRVSAKKQSKCRNRDKRLKRSTTALRKERMQKDKEKRSLEHNKRRFHKKTKVVVEVDKIFSEMQDRRDDSDRDQATELVVR